MSSNSKQNLNIRMSKAPTTLAELENQLLQSVERLDRGEGVSGKEAVHTIRAKIKQFHAGS